MFETKRILVGEVRIDDWLKEAILDYIEKNPMVEDIDVHKHFKMRVDLIANILTELRIQNKIQRNIMNGKMYYHISEFTNEEIQNVCLPTPFGNI